MPIVVCAHLGRAEDGAHGVFGEDGGDPQHGLGGPRRRKSRCTITVVKLTGEVFCIMEIARSNIRSRKSR